MTTKENPSQIAPARDHVQASEALLFHVRTDKMNFNSF